MIPVTKENILASFLVKDDAKQTKRNEQEYLNGDEKSNSKHSCHKVCLSKDQSAEIWTERNGKVGTNDMNDINDTLVRRWTNRSHENKEEPWHCDSVLTSLNFWGANMVVFANIIYIIPYIIVVLVYFAVLDKSTRAYHKAVISYNISQVLLNGILIGIGACVLCHVSICANVYVFLGLTIMFLTISSTFWLFVICIDMALVITRFRWTSPSNNNHEDEKQKFLTYAAWTWGGSLLPTLIAGIAELSPLLPDSSPVRPNFHQFNDGANLAVIVYVLTVPALTCLANTILFCYTSYKMKLIQKSTKIATANSTFSIGTMKSRYFIFLRLYLLMDAPWFTSALAAAFTDLWLLKFLRMIQPILMLFAILPPGAVSRAFTFTCLRPKSNCTFKIDQPP